MSKQALEASISCIEFRAWLNALRIAIAIAVGRQDLRTNPTLAEPYTTPCAAMLERKLGR